MPLWGSEALASYWLSEDSTGFEIILSDPLHRAVRRDPNTQRVIKPVHEHGDSWADIRRPQEPWPWKGPHILPCPGWFSPGSLEKAQCAQLCCYSYRSNVCKSDNLRSNLGPENGACHRDGTTVSLLSDFV